MLLRQYIQIYVNLVVDIEGIPRCLYNMQTETLSDYRQKRYCQLITDWLDIRTGMLVGCDVFNRDRKAKQNKNENGASVNGKKSCVFTHFGASCTQKY